MARAAENSEDQPAFSAARSRPIRCGTSMPAEKICAPPVSTMPRAPSEGAACTAVRNASSSSGVSALTGGRARRISWMSPWRCSSMLMRASGNLDVGGPTIPHRVGHPRRAFGRDRQREAGGWGGALARRHGAGDDFPVVPARQRLDHMHGGRLGLGVAHQYGDALFHAAAGAVLVRNAKPEAATVHVVETLSRWN